MPRRPFVRCSRSIARSLAVSNFTGRGILWRFPSPQRTFIDLAQERAETAELEQPHGAAPSSPLNTRRASSSPVVTVPTLPACAALCSFRHAAGSDRWSFTAPRTTTVRLATRREVRRLRQHRFASRQQQEEEPGESDCADRRRKRHADDIARRLDRRSPLKGLRRPAERPVESLDARVRF